MKEGNPVLNKIYWGRGLDIHAFQAKRILGLSALPRGFGNPQKEIDKQKKKKGNDLSPILTDRNPNLNHQAKGRDTIGRNRGGMTGLTALFQAISQSQVTASEEKNQSGTQ